MITELGLAALITAAGSSVAGLITALVQGMRTRAEVRQMQTRVTASMATASRELTHDHGTSMKDSSDRTERKVDALTEGLQAQTAILARQGEQLDGVRAEQTREGDLISELKHGLGGLRDDVRQNRSNGDAEHKSLRDDVQAIRHDIQRIKESPCGWDYGDHVTNFRAAGRHDGGQPQDHKER